MYESLSDSEIEYMGSAGAFLFSHKFISDADLPKKYPNQFGPEKIRINSLGDE